MSKLMGPINELNTWMNVSLLSRLVNRSPLAGYVVRFESAGWGRRHGWSENQSFLPLSFLLNQIQLLQNGLPLPVLLCHFVLTGAWVILTRAEAAVMCQTRHLPPGRKLVHLVHVPISKFLQHAQRVHQQGARRFATFLRFWAFCCFHPRPALRDRMTHMGVLEHRLQLPLLWTTTHFLCAPRLQTLDFHPSVPSPTSKLRSVLEMQVTRYDSQIVKVHDSSKK